MITQTKPNGKCYTCGNVDWWYNGRNWNCARCHPSPNPISSENTLIVVDATKTKAGETAKIQTVPLPAQDVETLRARVAAGVEKLVSGWMALKELPDPDYAIELDRLFKSVNKLRILCTELEALGYRECLWAKEPYPKLWRYGGRGCDAWPDNLFCWVCPMTIADYWNKNIDNTNKHEVKPAVKDAIVREFLRTLGGLI